MQPLFEHMDTLRRMWRHPGSSRDEILTFRDRKLRSVVTHAYENVPYYRRLFDVAGVKPQDLRSVSDLAALPVTSSRELRVLPVTDIVAEGANPERLVQNRTSGSTGRIFTIRRSNIEEHLLNMFRIRARQQIGVRICDRIAMVGVFEFGTKKIFLLGQLQQALGFYRSYRIELSEGAETVLRKLTELQPDVIIGYPGILGQIARFAVENAAPKPTPRIVITGGDTLNAEARRDIEDAFGVGVFDMYGAHEFNLLAWQCPESMGEFNVCDDSLVLELLRDGKPVLEGEVGDVVVTALHSYAMPFIRYSLGDVAVRGRGEYKDGTPFSTLGELRGRVVDLFKRADGRTVHPVPIMAPVLCTDYRWVGRYQLTQESLLRLVMYIVPLREPTEAEREKAARSVKKHLGEQVKLEVRLVDEIPFEQSGKYRAFRCFVH